MVTFLTSAWARGQIFWRWGDAVEGASVHRITNRLVQTGMRQALSNLPGALSTLKKRSVAESSRAAQKHTDRRIGQGRSTFFLACASGWCDESCFPYRASSARKAKVRQ